MKATIVSRAAFALCVVAVAVAGLWWVTAGSWDLQEMMSFGTIYDEQARSFFSGRANIECSAASGEAFIVNEKCYVYFGPVPALLRMPVHAVFPGLFGHLSRVMVWASNLLLLAFLLLILGEAGYAPGSWVWSAFLLLVAFGTTIQYMWSWPTGYVEAIAWGTAFGAGAIYCLLHWARVQSDGWLVAACVLGLLSFFSRVTTGFGPLTVTGIIAIWLCWRGGARRRLGASILVTLAVFAGVYMAYNHARFGTLADGMPVQFNVQYKAERLEKVHGTLFHPIQAPPIFANYLFHTPRFRESYPWLEYRPGVATDVGPVDMMDPHTGVLPMMPVFGLLWWGGWRSLRGRRRQRWMLLAALPGLVLLASVVVINHRYVHEFLLLFVPGAAFGLRWAWSTLRLRAITILLALFGFYANWAIALVAQRETLPWTSDKAHDRHLAMRFNVDRRLGLAAPLAMPLDYDVNHPPPPVAGVEVRFRDTASRYRFDGARWQHVSGPATHRFTVRWVGGTPMEQPKVFLVMAGQPGAADAVVLERMASGDRYRVCIDHWGSSDSACSSEMAMETGREYVLVCDFDRLNRNIEISLDGKVLVRRQTNLHYWTDATTYPDAQ